MMEITTFSMDREIRQDIFDYFVKNETIIKELWLYCSMCGNQLHTIYTFIIQNLRKAGIIVKDSNLICCFCRHVKNNPELTEVKRALNNIL